MKDEPNSFETYANDMRNMENPIGSFDEEIMKKKTKKEGKIAKITKTILCIFGVLFILILIYGFLDDKKFESDRLKEDGYHYFKEEEFVIENGTLLIPSEYNGEILRDVLVGGYYDDENVFTKISIPASIENIDLSYVVQSDIEEFIVDEENPYFSTFEGSLYNKDKSILIFYAKKSDGKKFPDTLKEISYDATRAFFGIRNLTDFEVEYSLDAENDKLQKYIKIKVEK